MLKNILGLKVYLKNKIIVSFDKETGRLQAFDKKGYCIHNSIAWVRLTTDKVIETSQIMDLKIKIDELENGKTRC